MSGGYVGRRDVVREAVFEVHVDLVELHSVGQVVGRDEREEPILRLIRLERVLPHPAPVQEDHLEVVQEVVRRADAFFVFDDHSVDHQLLLHHLQSLGDHILCMTGDYCADGSMGAT